MKKGVRYALCLFAVAGSLFAASADARSFPSDPDLAQGVRLALWNVPDDVMRAVERANLDGGIDSSFRSQAIGDFDVFVAFADDIEDLSVVPFADTLGFDAALLTRRDGGASFRAGYVFAPGSDRLLRVVIFDGPVSVERVSATCIGSLIHELAAVPGALEFGPGFPLEPFGRCSVDGGPVALD